MRKLIAGLVLFTVLFVGFWLARRRNADLAASPPLTRQLPAMGTILAFTVHPNDARAESAVAEAMAEIERLNEVFSNYRETSLISVVNRADREGTAVTKEFLLMLDHSRRMWHLTNGRFDVTVGPLIKLWGFERREGRVPDPAAIARILPGIGFDKVILEGDTVRFMLPGMALDFGAVVKGYAVDRAAAILKRHGLENFLVDLGGNMFASGAPPGQGGWRIGIRDPRDLDRIVGVIRLRDEAVATSGDYERMFEEDGKRYAHIVDPRTGYPIEEMASTTAIADDALTADLFSTALFLCGPEKSLLEQPGLRGALFGWSRAPQPEAIEWAADPRLKRKLLSQEIEIRTVP